MIKLEKTYSLCVRVRIYTEKRGLTLIRKVLVDPSISLTLEIEDTAAPGVVTYRLHLSNISNTISFFMYILFVHNNRIL